MLGVLEDASERALVRRLRRLPSRAWSSATVALISSGGRGSSRNSAARPPRPAGAPSAGTRGRARSGVRHSDPRPRRRARARGSPPSRSRRRRRSSARRRRPSRGSRRRTRSRRARRRVRGGGRPRSSLRRRRRAARPRPPPRRARPPSRSASASTPSSAISRFEPRPIVTTASPSPAAQPSASSSSAKALRASEMPRRAADPDRRQPPERDVLLDRHASLSRRSGTARSTSPAPTVSATSPGRARAARKAAPCSTLGVQPTVDPRSHLREGVDDELARSRPRPAPRGRGRSSVTATTSAVASARRELTDEVTRARVQVRLEEDEDAAAVANGVDRGRDLGRVVRVVVEHRHAAGLPVRLEAPARAGELGEVRARFLGRDAGQLERRERRGGVAPVVLARHRELEVRPARARPPARPGAPRRASAAKSSSTSARDANSEWWSRSTFVTTAILGRRRSIVRSDSSPSTTSQPEPARALPPSCGISPPIRNDGSRPSAVEDEGDHPGRRRLAVRAGDDDRVLQRNELGEKLGPALRAMSEGQSLGHVGGGHDCFEAVRRGLDLVGDA